MVVFERKIISGKEQNVGLGKVRYLGAIERKKKDRSESGMWDHGKERAEWAAMRGYRKEEKEKMRGECVTMEWIENKKKGKKRGRS